MLLSLSMLSHSSPMIFSHLFLSLPLPSLTLPPQILTNKTPPLGLISLQTGPPIELTAPMAKGFDMGAVVVLDYVESLATFFTHPSHIE